MAKLNLKQMALSYIGGTTASLTTGYVLAGLYDHYGGYPDYPTVVGGAWLLVVGVPSCLVAADKIREAWGQRKKTTVSASSWTTALGRLVPINYPDGTTKHTFLSSLPATISLKHQQQQPEINTPDAFTVSMDGNDYTVTEPEIDHFLRTAWRLQRQGKHGLSRAYWTRRHRPPLHRLEYDVRMMVLLSLDGLIVDRGERRSGRLTLPPQMALYALG
jgi:hypothetical protein